ncbi:MAG: hypothetical protein JO253_08085 [Alphaproteobacteria bacterium]|nr:hypothetical protein [Alphaproteobacteria bacterium]
MSGTTADTIDMVKGILGGGGSEDIAKSITTANGLVAYDLQAPAKNLYPVVTPLRNSVPRVGGGTGVATNWRTVTAINGSGFGSMPWIPEGQRSARMSYNTAPKSANYVTIGEEDQVSFESVSAGRTFEDVRATMTVRLLQKTFLKEEIAILGGNASLALGTPGTITTSASGTGGSLPAATYGVIVVALSVEGYVQSSVANGVATNKSITGADGNTFTLNGGSSNKSAEVTQVVGAGNTLFASVPSINGAVAYAWFIGPAGNETLQAITTINSVAYSNALIAGTQNISAVTQDSSRNSGLAFDGLLTTALLPASSAYVNYLPSGTAGTGSYLTASGAGTVVEIDNALKGMWDNAQLSATVMYVNSQELKNITKKCLSTSGNAPLLQYNNQTANGQPYKLTAGGVIAAYFNPYTPDGGRMIPIKLHPNVPPGTILLYAEELPVQYQNNNVSNVAEVKTRQDYYQIDWPVRTRQYETGVYSEQVLAVYAPFAMGAILNIANG